MARPRKSMRYGEILNPLSVAELKVLKVEVAAEIRIKEREVLKEKQEEQKEMEEIHTLKLLFMNMEMIPFL